MAAEVDRQVSDARTLEQLDQQLRRMRGMLFGYSQLFFTHMRVYTVVVLALLVVSLWPPFGPAVLIVPFLIPFVFVYHPAVLYKLQILFELFGDELPTSRAMIDISTVGWGDLGWIVIAFAVSMWMLTSALTGYEKNRLHGLERLARVVAGIAVLMPDMTIAGPGLAASAALIVGHRFLKGDRSPVDIPST